MRLPSEVASFKTLLEQQSEFFFCQMMEIKHKIHDSHPASNTRLQNLSLYPIYSVGSLIPLFRCQCSWSALS